MKREEEKGHFLNHTKSHATIIKFFLEEREREDEEMEMMKRTKRGDFLRKRNEGENDLILLTRQEARGREGPQCSLNFTLKFGRRGSKN